MPLTADDVDEILRCLDASSYDELYLEMDGLTLHLRRAGSGIEHVTPGAAETATANTDAAARAPARASAQAPADANGLAEIRSDFLGTFYRAPKPGEAPFVEPGSTVTSDSVVAIVEVMKLMNSVRAGVSGEIVEVCAGDGDMVEYGQVIFRVKPADEAAA